MYAIEAFVGRKYGRWARSIQRFDTDTEAQAEIAATERGERRAEATSFMRRVVRIRPT